MHPHKLKRPGFRLVFYKSEVRFILAAFVKDNSSEIGNIFLVKGDKIFPFASNTALTLYSFPNLLITNLPFSTDGSGKTIEPATIVT
jgi:hypothetical protein